ncbi:hypothetical protein [Sphingobium yanoikuyae]|jgi:hypothetical protein|uniref:hypothetical protein n=1 Tax=Sphingobium yanoikuyae TaxID=13690 RepID=UPI001929B2F8|nr:hypothetical protein [Sphingobium yanoikuyae]HEV7434508.1 hypothetical protein [Pseudorhizobium sp.]
MDHVNGIGVLSRRSFLGGAIGSSTIFALAPAFAETTKPEVDAVTIQVLVDNATFGPFLPDLTLPRLKVVGNTGDKGKTRTAPRALSDISLRTSFSTCSNFLVLRSNWVSRHREPSAGILNPAELKRDEPMKIEPFGTSPAVHLV